MADDWDGADRPYVSPWWEVRSKALERDNHKCQICESTREELGSEPDVHHIKPVREFADSRNAHTLENVVALCRSCHRYAEIGDIPRAFLRNLVR